MLALFFDRVSSPLGTLALAWDDEQRLRVLDFQTHETRMARLLRRHYGEGGYTLVPAPAPAAIAVPLGAYFAGALRAIETVPVETGGTEFQRHVWAALREIPAGTTTTYRELAASIGRPSACRAVGLANGANPVGIVVPCHRVIGADGTLTGYGGGLERKRWLLAHERGWTAPLLAAQEGGSA
jgi:methylated-DNA-[protein]-cysteine S-methyltransferase